MFLGQQNKDFKWIIQGSANHNKVTISFLGALRHLAQRGLPVSKLRSINLLMIFPSCNHMVELEKDGLELFQVVIHFHPGHP